VKLEHFSSGFTALNFSGDVHIFFFKGLAYSLRPFQTYLVSIFLKEMWF
jgi:hypothetical protein